MAEAQPGAGMQRPPAEPAFSASPDEGFSMNVAHVLDDFFPSFPNPLFVWVWGWDGGGAPLRLPTDHREVGAGGLD